MKLGVLVSGRGTNLRNLCERGLPVVAVASNRPACPAAAYARAQGLPLGEFPQSRFGSLEARDLAMRDWLLGRGVELVVNAGYDRVLSAGFLAAFRGRILNVHPSLLPAFKGTLHAVEEALAAGVKETGCTIHLVTEDVDGGPILLQATVPVLEEDTLETLHARIRVEEHRLLPEAIRLVEAHVEAGSPLR